ncbi:MAG: preprotein translocase subunit YajC, partial [Planctomycetota bacterium]
MAEEAGIKTGTGPSPSVQQGTAPARQAEGIPSIGDSSQRQLGAQPPPQDPSMNLLVLFVPMGLIFYFLLIRPESKRRKEKEALLNALKPKDKVVTVGGLRGTVVEVDGDEVVLLAD